MVSGQPPGPDGIGKLGSFCCGMVGLPANGRDRLGGRSGLHFGLDRPIYPVSCASSPQAAKVPCGVVASGPWRGGAAGLSPAGSGGELGATRRFTGYIGRGRHSMRLVGPGSNQVGPIRRGAGVERERAHGDAGTHVGPGNQTHLE